MFECPQTRGADPSIRTENYDPYLSPGLKLAIEVALDDEVLRGKLKALDKKYAKASRRTQNFHVEPVIATVDPHTLHSTVSMLGPKAD